MPVMSGTTESTGQALAAQHLRDILSCCQLMMSATATEKGKRKRSNCWHPGIWQCLPGDEPHPRYKPVQSLLGTSDQTSLLLPRACGKCKGPSPTKDFMAETSLKALLWNLEVSICFLNLQFVSEQLPQAHPLSCMWLPHTWQVPWD